MFLYFRSFRQRRLRDKTTSEDSAGPSHSTADESETWSAEEDGDEVKYFMKIALHIILVSVHKL